MVDVPFSRTPPADPVPTVRYERLDALRGFAVWWMAIFHFAYDLNWLSVLAPRQRFFGNPFWATQRTVILSLFLLTAGVALVLATARNSSFKRFAQRWLHVALAALAVSLATWWMFPKQWIWFGVLHAMAVMLLLARALLLVRASNAMLLVLAVAAVVLPITLRAPMWDAKPLAWLGLGLVKPVTHDWVPLLPWVAAMLAGMMLGRFVLVHQPRWATAPVNQALSPMVVLGQWSLVFYLLHQPIFLGALNLYLWARGSPTP